MSDEGSSRRRRGQPSRVLQELLGEATQREKLDNVLKVLQHSIKVNQAYFTMSLHTYL